MAHAWRWKETLAACLLAAILAAGPAAAQSGGSGGADGDEPSDLAREGMGKIVSALEMLLLTIPMYEMPEVQPNGDIIIRRKNPPKKDGDPAPESDPQGEEDPNPI